jgi:hypothetical protein
MRPFYSRSDLDLSRLESITLYRYRDSPGTFFGAGATSGSAGFSFAARKVVRPDSDLYASGEPNQAQPTTKNIAVIASANLFTQIRLALSKRNETQNYS